MIVLVWCIAPSVNNESTVIFARIMYPLFLKFSKQIDNKVGKARKLFSVGVVEIKTVMNSSKLLKDIAGIRNKFVETFKTKLTKCFENLTDAAT